MLAKRIKINSFLNDSDIELLKQYSISLSTVYNLCLQNLKENSDFNKIQQITKDFAKENKLHSKHAQNVGREVINSVKSYFAKKKKDKTARYPKNERIYSPILLDANIQKRGDKIYIGGGFKFISKQIQINKPKINIDLSNCDYYDTNAINIDTIKQLVFKPYENGDIYLIFVYSEQRKEKEYNYNFMSIDLGVSSIASIYESNGGCIKIQTKRFKSLEEQINSIKSKLSKKVKSSNKYLKLIKTKQRKQQKLTNKRKDYLHKTSKFIIDECKSKNIDNIIIGDIQTKKCKKNYKCKLNKSTQNEGLLSRFKSFIQYKAELNNIKFIPVNESYTSQLNCITDKIEFKSKLDNRIVEILPSVFIDRDINSAVNIAKQYGLLWFNHTFNYQNLLNVQKINIQD